MLIGTEPTLLPAYEAIWNWFKKYKPVLLITS